MIPHFKRAHCPRYPRQVRAWGETQRNFTDPDARIIKTQNGFTYAYNAKAVVDDTPKVIVAVEVTQQAGDVPQLAPLYEAMTCPLESAGIADHADVFLANAGYFSHSTFMAAKSYDPHT